MAESSFSAPLRSVLAFHDNIWQISWGETQTIASLQEEMARAARQEKMSRALHSTSSWKPQQQALQAQPHSGGNACYLGGFQAVGFVMTNVAGLQCQVPTLVLAPQQEQCPATVAHGEPKQGSQQEKVHPRKSARGAAVVGIDGSRDISSGSSLKSHALNTASPSMSIQENLTRDTFEGELPSVGSEGHFDGSCKRCAFFPKGRCLNGKDCTHCHFPHEPRSRLRKRGHKGSYAEEGSCTGRSVAEVDDCSSEVLAYSAMAPISARKSEPSSDSEADLVEQPATTAPSSKDDAQAIMKKLNAAIQEAAEAYAVDSTEAPKHHWDSADADTHPSSSALSDVEDSATVSSVDCVLCPFGLTDESKKGSASEASDSESASLQEGTVSSAPSDQGETHAAGKASRAAVPRKRDVLSPSSSSWSAMRSTRKASLDEDCSAADIERMARALLNKLTEERFESLCSQVLSLPISTTEHLAVVVAEIFEKATTQDCFRSLYTELCMRLDEHLSAQTNTTGGKAFRRALVTECQATFECNLQPADPALFAGLNGSECFEVEVKLKTRRLGNMRFIGDLLVRRLLAPKLLPPIVHELLNGDEAALESLIALLTIVAPEFEMKPSLYQAPLRDAFGVLRQKFSDKAVCPRLCCQINDVLDAKARGWASRSALA